MTVTLSKLPVFIQNQIPLSIRVFKDEYEFVELPGEIQDLIRPYTSTDPTVRYFLAFDILPEISVYGDFKTIPDIVEVISEYIKNYLMIRPGDYPFDPNFGSKLKEYLHTKDTTFRRHLISQEVNNIITVIQADLGNRIKVNRLDIIPTSQGAGTEFHIEIVISINDDEKQFNLEVS